MPEVWHIYHVQNCRHVRPEPKNKYVVIVCRDLRPMGFLINTGIHPLIRKRPELLACQALIEESHHRCLSHDSYVDCIDLYDFEDAELVEGDVPVSEQAMLRIKEAVNNSKTIELRYKKLILGET